MKKRVLNDNGKSSEDKDVMSMVILVVLVFFIAIYMELNLSTIIIFGIVIFVVGRIITIVDSKSEPKKTEEEIKKEKEEAEQKAFDANKNNFIREAKEKYYRITIREGGMKPDQYTDGPFEIWGTKSGFRIVPKWEFYEKRIEDCYRKEIIEKKSGDIVRIDLVEIGEDDFECIFSKDIITGLEGLGMFARNVEGRTEDYIKAKMQEELERRLGLNTFD